MAKVMTQLDCLTTQVMKDPPKAVNAIASKGTRDYDDEELEKLDEDIRFLLNRLRRGGGSCLTY